MTVSFMNMSLWLAFAAFAPLCIATHASPQSVVEPMRASTIDTDDMSPDSLDEVSLTPHTTLLAHQQPTVMFLATLESILAPGGIFDEHDKDHDGLLTRDEADMPKEVFDQFDTNHDDHISRDEFILFSLNHGDAGVAAAPPAGSNPVAWNNINAYGNTNPNPLALIDMRNGRANDPVATDSCWRWVYRSDVAGTVPTICSGGNQLDAGLCYPPCQSGYNPVGPVCWGTCRAGFTDIGAICSCPARVTSAGTSCCPWYDACCSWSNTGCPSCPQTDCGSYSRSLCTCNRGDNSYAKQSYGRGVGTVPTVCPSGKENVAGLCYTPCRAGFVRSAGVLCQSTCAVAGSSGSGPLSVDCGMMCSISSHQCSSDTGTVIGAGIGLGAAIIAAVAASVATGGGAAIGFGAALVGLLGAGSASITTVLQVAECAKT